MARSALYLWIVLSPDTDFAHQYRRPRLVAIPPFILFIGLLTCGKAGLSEAVTVIPTAVNIGAVVVVEWERGQRSARLSHAEDNILTAGWGTLSA
jgi:hypothetical protein